MRRRFMATRDHPVNYCTLTWHEHGDILQR